MRNVLIVGASCRAVAQSASAAGYGVRALDLFADRDLRTIAECWTLNLFPDSAVELAIRFPAMPLVLAGGMENHPEVVEKLAAHHLLQGANAAQLRQLRAIDNLKLWSIESGLAFPETTNVLPTHAECWLWKPHRSAGGSKILDAKWNMESNDGYWQEKVSGIPISAVLICRADGPEIVGWSQSLQAIDWPGPTRYGYRGSIVPLQIPESIQRKVQELGFNIVESTGLRGLLGVDMMWEPSSNLVWLLELNPRWTASMELHEQCTNRNLFAEHLEACGWNDSPRVDKAVTSSRFANSQCESESLPDRLTDDKNSSPREITSGEPILRKYYAKAILFAEHEIEISSDQSDQLMKFAKYRTGTNSELALGDIPAAETHIASGSPVLSIMACGSTQEEGLTRLHDFRKRVLAILGGTGTSNPIR